MQRRPPQGPSSFIWGDVQASPSSLNVALCRLATYKLKNKQSVLSHTWYAMVKQIQTLGKGDAKHQQEPVLWQLSDSAGRYCKDPLSALEVSSIGCPGSTVWEELSSSLSLIPSGFALLVLHDHIQAPFGRAADLLLPASCWCRFGNQRLLS